MFSCSVCKALTVWVRALIWALIAPVLVGWASRAASLVSSPVRAVVILALWVLTRVWISST